MNYRRTGQSNRNILYTLWRASCEPGKWQVFRDHHGTQEASNMHLERLIATCELLGIGIEVDRSKNDIRIRCIDHGLRVLPTGHIEEIEW